MNGVWRTVGNRLPLLVHITDMEPGRDREENKLRWTMMMQVVGGNLLDHCHRQYMAALDGGHGYPRGYPNQFKMSVTPYRLLLTSVMPKYDESLQVWLEDGVYTETGKLRSTCEPILLDYEAFRVDVELAEELARGRYRAVQGV